MIAPYNQSGWLVQRPDQPHANFEIVVAAPSPYHGLIHIWRDRDLPFVPPEKWNFALRGPFHGAVCILSRYGNLEAVVAQTDGLLAHFWRNDANGWRGPIILPGQAAGPPAFIQSRFGSFGNFEVVVPRVGGGLSHLWRRNDSTVAWREAQPLRTDGIWSGVALVHNSYGNLELIGIRDRKLVLMVQNGEGGAWLGPIPVDDRNDLYGRPAFIQRASFPSPTFEVVAAGREGLFHYSRNEHTRFLWRQVSRFGTETETETDTHPQFNDVTMIESTFGYLEVFAKRTSGDSIGTVRLRHYRRAEGDWSGPDIIPPIICDS